MSVLSRRNRTGRERRIIRRCYRQREVERAYCFDAVIVQLLSIVLPTVLTVVGDCTFSASSGLQLVKMVSEKLYCNCLTRFQTLIVATANFNLRV